MRRSRFARPRGTKRKYEWEWAGIFGTFNAVPDVTIATWARVPASKVDNANSSGIPYVIPDDSTLIRTRCLLQYSSSNGAQASYPWIASAGLIAWDGTTDDTNDLGIIPSPYWDQDLDWIFRVDAPSVVRNYAIRENTGDIDSYQSKAMRKLSAGTGLLFVWTYADPLELGTIDNLGITLAVNMRMLFKQA